MPSSTSEGPALADPRGRRRVVLAVAHGLLALAFLAAFVWVQAHK